MFRAIALTAAAVVFAAASVAAQQDQQRQAPFVFEAGDVELTQLIDRCARYLQRNILYDEAELVQVDGERRPPRRRGRAGANEEDGAGNPSGPVVSLQLPVVTDRDGCEEMLCGLLWRHGFALVVLDEGKRVYEVLLRSGPRRSEIVQRAVHRTPLQVLARPTLRQVVSCLHTLDHINAQVASNSLRAFYASNSGNNVETLAMTAIGNSASIVLTGPQDAVARALTVLASADKPLKPSQQLLHKRIEALTKRIEQLEERLEK